MAGNIKDFATGTVLTAPSPDTSGTSLVLSSGQGARMPAVPFHAVVHPPSEMPTLDNAEKVLVTAVSTDTLTITRAQGDTTAKAIEAGWRLSNALFKENLDDKEFVSKVTPIAASTSTAAGTAAKVATTSGGSYSPVVGDIVLLTLSSANTATSPTVNIDGSGAKSILLGNINPTGVAMAGTRALMWYDGTAFQLFGSQRVSDTDTNTTYLEATAFSTTTGTTQAAAVNNGYIANNAAEINYTLPATSAVGQIVHVLGLGAGGWRVTAPSGDNILINGNNSGTAGYIFGPQGSTVGLRCIVANATWEVVDYTGTIGTGAGYTTNILLDEDNLSSNSDVKAPTQQSIKAYVDAAITATKSALYPVGSIYSNYSNSTNPATLLGFGTWVAAGVGRMLMGVGTGTKTIGFSTSDVNATADVITVPAGNTDLQTGQAVVITSTGTVPAGLTSGTTYYIVRTTSTTVALATSRVNALRAQAPSVINITSTGSGTHTFTISLTARTASETGGEESTNLAQANLPSNLAGSWGIHGQENGTVFAGWSGLAQNVGGVFVGKYGNLNYYTGSQSITNPGFDLQGGSAPQNNLPPYEVVYMWRRTA